VKCIRGLRYWGIFSIIIQLLEIQFSAETRFTQLDLRAEDDGQHRRILMRAAPGWGSANICHTGKEEHSFATMTRNN